MLPQLGYRSPTPPPDPRSLKAQKPLGKGESKGDCDPSEEEAPQGQPRGGVRKEGLRWWRQGTPRLPGPWGRTEQVTLMEALAKRDSCLMCCPFFPMMAPTACAGMNTCTISCSGACCRNTVHY